MSATTSAPARAFLLPTGIIFIQIGAAAAIAPQSLVAPFAVHLATGDAAIAVRSGTGGLFAGLGVFWVWASLKPDRHHTALVSAACVIGGSFLMRGLGIALEGGAGASQLISLVLEGLGDSNALGLLWRIRKG